MNENYEASRNRWSFLVAGLAALSVAVFWLLALEDSAIWMFGRNAGLAIYIPLGVLLLVSTLLPRSTARFIGGVAAIVFGAIGTVFMYHVFVATGSPFTFPQWIPPILTAFLAAFASVRA